MTKLQRNGLSSLSLATVLFLLPVSLTHRADRHWIEAMIVLAGLESMGSFWTLSTAMRGSSRLFYRVFGGGFLVRLLLLGVVAAVLHRWAPSLAAPLVAFVLAYFAGLLVQIPFFLRIPEWISSKS